MDFLQLSHPKLTHCIGCVGKRTGFPNISISLHNAKGFMKNLVTFDIF